jgi:hypothetical protein
MLEILSIGAHALEGQWRTSKDGTRRNNWAVAHKVKMELKRNNRVSSGFRHNIMELFLPLWDRGQQRVDKRDVCVQVSAFQFRQVRGHCIEQI